MTKLILLDVFSYSCMNCLRSLEFIKKIDEKYRDFGLDTVLLHPPEWGFEKLKQNVEFASKRYKINFPIIIDKDKKIIIKLKIKFWPAQVLVKDSKVLYSHIGEGDYKKLENRIAGILKLKKKKIFDKEPKYTKFPTIYCGSRKKGRIRGLKSHSKVRFGTIYKKGRWVQKNEFILSEGKNNLLTILTKGKVINFVARSIGKKQKKIEIRINDKFVRYLTINKPQLYNIINLKNSKIHKLSLSTKSGLAIYSFSFQ
ncbi:hypothetical protein HYX02_00805 [Candidatus Woesearchaeota archaeon]|nr:hypothetical protein [Candidatus Woesearchaeota archaeon]